MYLLTKSKSSVTLPPLISEYVVIKNVSTNNNNFKFPSFVVTFDGSDILTKRFFSKFYDLLINKYFEIYIDKPTNRQVWVPPDNIKFSIGFPEYECDWPLLAVIPYPEKELVLYSNSNKCNAVEMALLSLEYKSKVPLELYMKRIGKNINNMVTRTNFF